MPRPFGFPPQRWHPLCIGAAILIHHRRADMGDKNQGEGNREADRRYRRGVRETVS
jgi:hypothetical protein